jgi:hypothetical protein
MSAIEFAVFVVGFAIGSFLGLLLVGWLTRPPAPAAVVVERADWPERE